MLITRKFTNAAPAEAMFYDKKAHSSIRVADLKSGDVLPIKINTEGMGCFHFGNAYEIEGSQSVVPPNNSGIPNGSGNPEWFGRYRMVREFPNGSGNPEWFGTFLNFVQQRLRF